MSRFSLCTAVALAAATFGFQAHAEDGVTDSSITLGISNAQTGNAQSLGLGVTSGIQVFFDKINASGGIHGRKISLKVYDDGYEPPAAEVNTETLIDNDKVFALLGYVGTPTAKVVMPITVEKGVPLFAPFTGAGFLRTPVKDTVFNVRASYDDETGEIVRQLVDLKGKKKIALLMQNDAYGQVGKSGLEKALGERGMELVAIGTYERNTLDVLTALSTIQEAEPDAVVMVGAYGACAEFMKTAHEIDFKPIFVNISFVGTSALINAAGAAGEGSYVTQVMPNPFTSDLDIVKEFRADMKAAGKELDYTSLEGYVQAAIFAKALEEAGTDLTREALITALNSMSMNLGGLEITFSPENHQALQKVYLTTVKDGAPVSVEQF